MVEISNNTLAALLIVAVLVSIVGLVNTLTLIPVIQYTGVATGKANVTIESAVSIKLLKNESLFGAGFPNLVCTGRLDIATNQSNQEGDRGSPVGFFNNGTEGNNTAQNCTYGKSGLDDSGTCAEPFVVQNDGNDPATCVKINADKAAQAFIGGSQQTPLFQWAGMNNESAWGSSNAGCPSAVTDACLVGLNQTWRDMTTGSGGPVCTQLNHTDCSDEIRIHFLLGVPSDATGGKQALVTVSGCNPCGSC